MNTTPPRMQHEMVCPGAPGRPERPERPEYLEMTPVRLHFPSFHEAPWAPKKAENQFDFNVPIARIKEMQSSFEQNMRDCI